MASLTLRLFRQYKRMFGTFKQMPIWQEYKNGQFLYIFQRMMKISPQLISRYPVVLPCFVVHAAFGFGGSKKKESPLDKDQEIIIKADQFYHDNENSKVYDLLLEHKDSSNVEIMWRLSRAAYDKGQEADDKNEKKKYHFEAFEYIQKALTLSDQCFAVHKWMGILLDIVGEHEGNKKRIENSFLVKTHFEKAIELNPGDATSVYSLGFWHFLFADMAWYERKIAALVFSTPPTSTYETALEYFEKAEKINPNFYSMNLLMIGKCHLRMNDKENAKEYFKKVKAYPVKSLDDRKAHKEADEFLKSLGA